MEQQSTPSRWDEFLCFILGCKLVEGELCRSPFTVFTHYRRLYCKRCGESYGIVREYKDALTEPELFKEG